MVVKDKSKSKKNKEVDIEDWNSDLIAWREIVPMFLHLIMENKFCAYHHSTREDFEWAWRDNPYAL